MTELSNAVVVCRQHWMTLAAPVVLLAAALLLSVVLVALHLTAVAALLVLLCLLDLILQAIKLRSTVLYMTDTVVVGHTGVLRTKQLMSPVSKIQDISVSNGVFGKLLGYATVTVSTAGSARTSYRFPNVTNYMDLQSEFVELSARTDIVMLSLLSRAVEDPTGDQIVVCSGCQRQVPVSAADPLPGTDRFLCRRCKRESDAIERRVKQNSRMVFLIIPALLFLLLCGVVYHYIHGLDFSGVDVSGLLNPELSAEEQPEIPELSAWEYAAPEPELELESEPKPDYVLDLHDNLFHRPFCPHVDELDSVYRMDYNGSRSSVLSMGFSPCPNCAP